MGFLRNRMGMILVIVIGFALFAFIAGEVIHYGSSFFHGDSNEIGEVGGEKIAVYMILISRLIRIPTTFSSNRARAKLRRKLQAIYRKLPGSQEVNDKIFAQEMDKLGIVVGDDEKQDLIQGDNPSPQIVQAFGDPQTGQLDRAEAE